MGKGDSLWSALGELAEAFGNEVSGCIPGMDVGRSSSPSGSSPSAGSGTNYGSDGSYSGSSSSNGSSRTTRDRGGNVAWHSERVSDEMTYHYEGGKGLLSNPTHYSIDRGDGVQDHYRCSDNAPVSRSIEQDNGNVDYYDANGEYTGSTR